MSNLKGKTLFITGASRGIGKAVALRAAKDGANIAVVAKTAKPHLKLPGTVYSACEEIEKAGGKALPCIVDIRDEELVKKAIQKTAEAFGGIDILVNNASAITLTGTVDTEMKRYDLMNNVNTRGTFLCCKYAVPYLKKSDNPHVLTMSPPLNFKSSFFEPHAAYSLSKFGMSLCMLGMSEEFKKDGIAFNSLWPKTTIATAAIQFALGGDEMMKRSRTEEIMVDASYIILTKDSREFTGGFYIDEDLLRESGVTDFKKYQSDPNVDSSELMPDLFI